MAKIPVLFQVNELSYTGTTKQVLAFCRYLDRSQFEPFLFYRKYPRDFKYYRHQLEALVSKRAKQRFHERYIISEKRLPDFQEVLGADHVFSGMWDQLNECIQKVKPRIVHFARGEEHDWYTDKVQEIPRSVKMVETSIFGKPSTEKYFERLDLVFVVSEWLAKQNPWLKKKGRSLYFPILAPAHNLTLREELNIPKNELVVGRLSRPGLDSGAEVLKIYNKLKTPCTLLVLGGGPLLTEAAKTNPKIICLPPTSSDERMSAYYNTLDVLLHYRAEGETLSMSISDTMIHGRPVVSHWSYLDNAQVEQLDIESSNPSGFIVKENDFDDHAAKIDLLLQDENLRKRMGQAAQTRASSLFEAKAVTKKLEAEYLRLLSL